MDFDAMERNGATAARRGWCGRTLDFLRDVCGAICCDLLPDLWRVLCSEGRTACRHMCCDTAAVRKLRADWDPHYVGGYDLESVAGGGDSDYDAERRNHYDPGATSAIAAAMRPMKVPLNDPRDVDEARRGLLATTRDFGASGGSTRLPIGTVSDEEDEDGGEDDETETLDWTATTTSARGRGATTRS